MTSRSDRALIIVDMLTEWVRPGTALSMPGAAQSVRYILGELQYFRERDRLVLFAVPTPTGASVDAGQRVVPDLTPRLGEAVLEHEAPSVFFRTDLESRLRAAGVRRVTLVGAGAATAILASAADAFARGFGVSVPEPCVSDREASDRDFALHLIRDVWHPVGGDPSLDEVSEPSRFAPGPIAEPPSDV